MGCGDDKEVRLAPLVEHAVGKKRQVDDRHGGWVQCVAEVRGLEAVVDLAEDSVVVAVGEHYSDEDPCG